MSKIFYDHLLQFEKIDKQIKKVVKTKEERDELWAIVDEIIHHKAIGCVLDNLPRQNHEEFLELFHTSPHDEDLLFGYLNKKVGNNVEEILKQELGDLAVDLLKEFNTHPHKKAPQH